MISFCRASDPSCASHLIVFGFQNHPLLQENERDPLFTHRYSSVPASPSLKKSLVLSAQGKEQQMFLMSSSPEIFPDHQPVHKLLIGFKASCPSSARHNAHPSITRSEPTYSFRLWRITFSMPSSSMTNRACVSGTRPQRPPASEPNPQVVLRRTVAEFTSSSTLT